MNQELFDYLSDTFGVNALDSEMQEIIRICTNKTNVNSNEWNNYDVQPPDEMVEVMDDFGNTALALPTFYHFKHENGQLIFVEKYWDKAWLIQSHGFQHPLKGKIAKWRKIEKKPE